MAKGIKTGGRSVGTPNRSTAEVRQQLEALGCDPIVGMAKIAIDESQPMALRASMYRELAQYVAPKRKAIEHKGDLAGSNPPVFVIDIGSKPE
jgi:hypothetical protein